MSRVDVSGIGIEYQVTGQGRPVRLPPVQAPGAAGNSTYSTYLIDNVILIRRRQRGRPLQPVEVVAPSLIDKETVRDEENDFATG